MIQLYREREKLFTGNSGNSGNPGGRVRRGFSRGIFGGFEVGKVPGPEGEEQPGKGWERPQTSPSVWDLGDPFPIPAFLGSLFLCQRKNPLFFPCSFPPPAPSGMSGRVSEFPARGPPEIPGVWNRLLPNKTHQKHSQTGKEFQEKQGKAKKKKKVDFVGKASPAPGIPGKRPAGPGTGNPKSPKIQHSRGILAGPGIVPAQIPIPAGSGIIPIPIPSFPRTPGRARGCFMYTAPIPGSEPIPRGDPGIPGILKFPGMLSCPWGRSWNSGNAEIPGNAQFSSAPPRSSGNAEIPTLGAGSGGDPGIPGTPQFLGTLSCPRGQSWNSRIPGNLSSPRSRSPSRGSGGARIPGNAEFCSGPIPELRELRDSREFSSPRSAGRG